jgi:predicted RNase H-like nuclease (RuvC/YqgF family)
MMFDRPGNTPPLLHKRSNTIHTITRDPKKNRSPLAPINVKQDSGITLIIPTEKEGPEIKAAKMVPVDSSLRRQYELLVVRNNQLEKEHQSLKTEKQKLEKKLTLKEEQFKDTLEQKDEVIQNMQTLLEETSKHMNEKQNCIMEIESMQSKLCELVEKNKQLTLLAEKANGKVVEYETVEKKIHENAIPNLYNKRSTL